MLQEQEIPEQQEESQQYEIPKIIHFIWAGGADLMPADNIETVAKWLRANPHFNVHFWIAQRPNEPIDILKNQYVMYFRQCGLASQEIDRIHLMDVAKIPELATNERLKKCIYYEMERLRANYGASSDLLRYLICYLYGGVYVDSDVEPGLHPLGTIRFGLVGEHQLLYVDHLTQKREVLMEQLKLFALEIKNFDISVGNDTFVCSQGNPLMRLFYEDALASYQNVDFDTSFGLAYNAEEIRDITVFRTGPIRVREVLEKCGIKKDDIQPVKKITVEEQPVQVKPVRCPAYQLTQPFEVNRKDWLKKGISKMPLEIVLEKAIMTVQFELETFRIIRLDGHIDEIFEATLGLIDEGDIANQLIERLASMSLNYHNADVIQLLFNRPLVLDFYNRHGLQEKHYSAYHDQTFPAILYFLHNNKLQLLRRVVEIVQRKQRLMGRFEKQELISLVRNMTQVHQFIHLRLYSLSEDAKKGTVKFNDHFDLPKLIQLLGNMEDDLNNFCLIASDLNRCLEKQHKLDVKRLKRTFKECHSMKGHFEKIERQNLSAEKGFKR